MSRAAGVTIPLPEQMLCERCGYVLTGLPAEANCPECGTPAAESSPALRRLPAWEDLTDGRARVVKFLETTAAVTFRPRAFYRSLVTRHPGGGARAFAMIHWGISSLLLGVAVYLHARWFTEFVVGPHAVFAAGMVVGVFVFFAATTWVAARLTRWEAAYRGLRLPLDVVLRAMYYHAAHYVPVCAGALVTVVGYQVLLRRGVVSQVSAPGYLYVLCGEVVVAASYLFKTYWTGMRNVMYANR